MLPASLLVEQSLWNVTFFFGLDDVNFAVELCPASLNFLRGLLVEVDHRTLVGGHPLLRDPQQRSENTDQESKNLFHHDLKINVGFNRDYEQMMFRCVMECISVLDMEVSTVWYLRPDRDNTVETAYSWISEIWDFFIDFRNITKYLDDIGNSI